MIEEWCIKWNIDLPEVKYINRGGSHEVINGKSVISISKDDHIILHELRHHYQYTKYPDMYIWWSKNFHIYTFFIKTQMCILEEDANIFCWTNGTKNGDFLLEMHIDFFKNAYEEIKNKKKDLKYYKIYIQELEIKHNVSIWKFNRRNIIGY